MVHLQTSPLLLLHHTAFPQLLEKNPHRSQGPAVHIPWSPVLALKVPLTALLTSKNCTPEAALSERMHFLWRANICQFSRQSYCGTLPAQTQPGADVQSSLTTIHWEAELHCSNSTAMDTFREVFSLRPPNWDALASHSNRFAMQRQLQG